MLSRRFLRIRVMQALYAWYQHEGNDIDILEKEMLKGTARVHDLYLQILGFFLELAHEEDKYYLDRPASALTGKKAEVKRYLSQNSFIQWLKENKEFDSLLREHKTSWQNDMDTVRKVFSQVRSCNEYKAYSTSEEGFQTGDIEFFKWLYDEYIVQGDMVKHTLEEKNIYWAESLEAVTTMIQRMLEIYQREQVFRLLPLFKDQDDDIEFMKSLFRKTIRDDKHLHQLISSRTANWDPDRIALVDIILMKMCLCEILNMPIIPVKVGLNEYIDISKDYSTPASKAFINGIIDKIVIELKNKGEVVKTGKGLVEESSRPFRKKD